MEMHSREKREAKQQQRFSIFAARVSMRLLWGLLTSSHRELCQKMPKQTTASFSMSGNYSETSKVHPLSICRVDNFIWSHIVEQLLTPFHSNIHLFVYWKKTQPKQQNTRASFSNAATPPVSVESLYKTLKCQMFSQQRML